MEVTINIDGQALSVEVTVEVYEYLDRAGHKQENLAHEKRRHWDSREFDEYIILTEGRSCYYQTPEQWVWTKEQAEKPEGKNSIMAQLYEKVAAMNKEYYALRGKIVTAERRIKVLDEHLSMWAKYERNKGIYRQFDKIKPGRKKEQFEQKHGAELALYEAAVRYLEKLKTTGEEITPKKWQAEADRLKAEKSVQYQKMKAMREDIKAVENLKKTAEQLSRTETAPARKKEKQEL